MHNNISIRTKKFLILKLFSFFDVKENEQHDEAFMDNQKEQIIEYIRDELEGEEKESFERLLSKNAKIKQEYENMKNIWDLYEKLPQIEINESLYEKTLHSVKHYKSKSIKIRMFRTQDKIDLDRKKAARRLFTPVSAAAAVLILATVIITVIASDIAVRNINKNNKYLASDSMKYVIAEKISDNELKMEIPEKSKKSLMNSKSNYLIKSVPEESMDESKKRENSADDADNVKK